MDRIAHQFSGSFNVSQPIVLGSNLVTVRN